MNDIKNILSYYLANQITCYLLLQPLEIFSTPHTCHQYFIHAYGMYSVATPHCSHNVVARAHNNCMYNDGEGGSGWEAPLFIEINYVYHGLYISYLTKINI